MKLIQSASFSGQDIRSEHAITAVALTEDVGLLGVVLALRGVGADSSIRELRVYLDDIEIDGVSTDNVPVNRADGAFVETHGATTTRLSVIVPGVRAGQTIDVRVWSGNDADSSVSGTCELLNLDAIATGDAQTLLTEMHLCKSALVNRQAQTVATGVVRIYDDDAETPLVTLTPTVDDVDSPTENVLETSLGS